MPDEMKDCQECGASIYQEHLDRGLAGFIAGKLLCSVCRANALGTSAAAPPTADATATDTTPAPAPEPTPASATSPASTSGRSTESIQLVDLDEAATPATPAAPHQAENRTAFGGAHDDSRLSRELSRGRNASRCRIFHTRISEGALVYLNEQINEWCDQQEDIEIKFATSTVGAFEGKQHVEHHLILTLFY